VADDLIVPMLRKIQADAAEFHEEFRASREETRKNFGQVFHRLNVIEATLSSLKADVAILLSAVPVINERMDALEARITALENAR
jgi:hypothetical protein